MGTNYYARRIPSHERIKKIKEAIDRNSYREIMELVEDTYGEPHISSSERTIVGGNIHLGKRSGGWKFIWNPNWYQIPKGHIEVHEEKDEKGNSYKRCEYIPEKPDIFKFYELTKKSLKDFIDSDDIEIYDEYNKKIDKEKFWRMANDWEMEDGSDGDKEFLKNDKFPAWYYFYKSNYVKFLEENGVKFTLQYNDFESDGLRFATTTEFS